MYTLTFVLTRVHPHLMGPCCLFKSTNYMLTTLEHLSSTSRFSSTPIILLGCSIVMRRAGHQGLFFHYGCAKNIPENTPFIFMNCIVFSQALELIGFEISKFGTITLKFVTWIAFQLSTPCQCLLMVSPYLSNFSTLMYLSVQSLGMSSFLSVICLFIPPLDSGF